MIDYSELASNWDSKIYWVIDKYLNEQAKLFHARRVLGFKNED